jgi:hypothetical protein
MCYQIKAHTWAIFVYFALKRNQEDKAAELSLLTEVFFLLFSTVTKGADLLKLTFLASWNLRFESRFEH